MDEELEKVHHPHDKGYKFLLSSRDVFLQLLQCFIAKDWVSSIDEESITPIDKSFILKDFTEKEADMVYRLKIKDQEVIFYILLELQSSVDFQMPYRLLTYMTGIWQEVVKNTSKEGLERKDFRLPVIVPIVLYNGEGSWTAPSSYKESLAGYQLFEDYVLDFKYFLLDVKRYTEKELMELANLIGSIFLVDQKRRDALSIIAIIKKLGRTIKAMPDRHITIFFRWVKHALPKPLSNDLMEQMEDVKREEVDPMISNLGRSFEDALVKAKTEGRQEGKREGRMEGRLEGIAEVIKNMLGNGMPEEEIARLTRIPLEQIREFKARKR